jgi:hypothetical protein
MPPTTALLLDAGLVAAVVAATAAQLTTTPRSGDTRQAFTGDVYLTSEYNGQEPSRMTVALVRFTPGARTYWHGHTVGQSLHIADGVGLVGTREGTVLRARAGSKGERGSMRYGRLGRTGSDVRRRRLPGHEPTRVIKVLPLSRAR